MLGRRAAGDSRVGVGEGDAYGGVGEIDRKFSNSMYALLLACDIPL
jgi:hypothetical protein